MAWRMWLTMAAAAAGGLLCAVSGWSRAATAEVKAPPDAGQASTEILKWKDGKRAVFILQFDDSCPSHITTAIPELKKRGMVGTFYINPGNGWYKSKRAAWEDDGAAAGVEYANHTFTHIGALGVAEFDQELGKCNEEIDRCFPDRKRPRLIAYGAPGGLPKENWRLSKEEMQQALAKHHLIERPPFAGPPFQMKTTEEVLKVIDRAITKGEMGHLDFHGVAGDCHPISIEMFHAVLDKLEACREQLWITDPISWHKYLTERKIAEIKLLQADDQQIRLQLSCSADPALYDMPLTLNTKVPAQWKQCAVVQGTTKAEVPVVGGAVRYSAVPGSQEITIRPLAAAAN